MGLSLRGTLRNDASLGLSDCLITEYFATFVRHFVNSRQGEPTGSSCCINTAVTVALQRTQICTLA